MLAKAYYNEIDPFAAQWLRNLINAGHIAYGDVDERSIEDVRPSELVGYTQCHFFAGVGVWSYALRRAGWPDDRPVWTGSCPCQPFSEAGSGDGFADKRHLWPSWFHLISQFKPKNIFGEQVEAAIRHNWLDLVQTDLEGIGYAFGSCGFPSAGVGAPHIRQRLYFAADTTSDRQSRSGTQGEIEEGWQPRPECVGKLPHGSEGYGVAGGMGITNSTGWESGRITSAPTGYGDTSISTSVFCGVGNNNNKGLEGWERMPECSDKLPSGENGVVDQIISADAYNTFWSGADWLGCRDGKFRPVESGTFPLANGATQRMGRLRAYGNAINAEAAKEFIKSYLECRPC